jgi:ketosteroid isomerase-like protein
MSTGDDRWAIDDLLHAYARHIDRFDFTAIAALFTEDAVVEYGGYPVMHGGAAVAAWLERRTADSGWHQHLVSVVEVDLRGDEADTVTYFVSHARSKTDAQTVRQHVGEYRDHLRRTVDGWRIAGRRQATGWKETRRSEP